MKIYKLTHAHRLVFKKPPGKFVSIANGKINVFLSMTQE